MTTTDKLVESKIFFDLICVNEHHIEDHTLGSFSINRSDLSEISSDAIAGYIIQHPGDFLDHTKMEKYKGQMTLEVCSISRFFITFRGFMLTVKIDEIQNFYAITNIHEIFI